MLWWCLGGCNACFITHSNIKLQHLLFWLFSFKRATDNFLIIYFCFNLSLWNKQILYSVMAKAKPHHLHLDCLRWSLTIQAATRLGSFFSFFFLAENEDSIYDIKKKRQLKPKTWRSIVPLNCCPRVTLK